MKRSRLPPGLPLREVWQIDKVGKAFVEREIILIPNGVDAEHFKPMEKNLALAESLGLTLESDSLLSDNAEQAPRLQSSPVIGFVGELREKKGLKTLLHAYALVNKEKPATLLIVGEVRQGEDQKTLDEFRLSNPDSQIVITGYVPHHELPAYYSLIDVFVHPSLRDGMPNAVLEAMACEKAVVARPVVINPGWVWNRGCFYPDPWLGRPSPVWLYPLSFFFLLFAYRLCYGHGNWRELTKAVDRMIIFPRKPKGIMSTEV